MLAHAPFLVTCINDAAAANPRARSGRERGREGAREGDEGREGGREGERERLQGAVVAVNARASPRGGRRPGAGSLYPTLRIGAWERRRIPEVALEPRDGRVASAAWSRATLA